MKYLFFLLIVMPLSLLGQGITISLLDVQTKQPVEFAHICIESQNSKAKSFIIADSKGMATFEFSESVTLAISAIGYITCLDTLKPGKKKVIYLTPKIYNVDEVVITGQQNPIRADKSIYKIDVISSAQIKDKASNNLADLLAAELNIRLSQDGALGTSVSIQGLSGEHVKILVDGIPVIGRQNGILDLNQVMLSNVDHVEIVEGPMSVIYGSNALAGAINIITRKPSHGKFIGKINTYYESVGIYDFDGSATVLKNKHSLVLLGGRKFFKGYNPFAQNNLASGNVITGWNPKLQYYSNFDYSYNGEKANLKISGNYFREILQSEGGSELYSIFDTIKLDSGQDSVKISTGINTNLQKFYTTRMDLKAEYQYKFSSHSNIESVISGSIYSKSKKAEVVDRVTLNESAAGEQMQDTTRFENVIFRTVYRNSPIGWVNFITGTDLNIETATGKRLISKKQIDDYAIFSSAKFFAEKKLNLQIGARVIYNSIYSAPVVYAVNLKYSPFKAQSFRISYGKGFRTPSLKELYLSFQDVNHSVFGNDSLRAEKSQNYSFSYTTSLFAQQIHSVTVDASLFYNKIKDKIDFVYDRLNPTWAKYYNISNFISKGFETKIRYNFHPRFSLSLGTYYLMRSGISDLSKFFTSTDYSVDFNYKNVKYLFKISAWYKYTDKWYTSRTDIDKSGAENSIVEGYMEGFHTLNFTISRPFFKNKLEVSAGGKNMFNNTMITSTGAGQNVHGGGGGLAPVGWGRTYFIGLTYNFAKY